MPIRSRAVSCALVFSICPATAATASTEPLPKIVVAGARYDQRRDDTAASVVVNRDELLRHGDRSLGDALKRVAGITVGTATGRNSGIRLRGLGEGYTQILINGVAAPNGFSIESLAPELIERVEIIRSASAELGTQSIAGTINIVMRRAASAAVPVLKSSLDRQGGAWSGGLSGEVGGTGSGITYAVPVTLARTIANSTQVGEESAPHVRRLSSQSERHAVTNLAFAPRASWNLEDSKLDLRTLLTAMQRRHRHASGETVLQGAPSRYPQRAAEFVLSGTSLRADAVWSRSLAGGARVEVKTGGDASRRSSNFDFGETRAGVRLPAVHFVRADFHDTGYSAGATYTAPLAGSHTLSAGWDGSHARRMQSRLGRDLDVAGVEVAERDERYHGTIDRAGLYLQDAWEINPAWSLSAGWRIEALATKVVDTQAQPVAQRSVISSPLLQVLYKAGSSTQLRAGIARTYKAPALPTLIPRRYAVDNNNSATNPDTQGNPALLPEKAWGVDAGIDYHPAKDSLVALSGYVRRISDVTVDQLFFDGGAWVVTPANQGRAVARGVALEVKLALPQWPALAVNGNLARNWSRIERIAGPDNRLDEQVPLSANLGLEYRGTVRAGLNLVYARGAVSSMSERWTTWTGGSRALDVYALWDRGGGLRLRLAATNLGERAKLSGSRYTEANSVRETLLRTSGGQALRMTLEYALKQ